jgi:hypothetical protein
MTKSFRLKTADICSIGDMYLRHIKCRRWKLEAKPSGQETQTYWNTVRKLQFKNRRRFEFTSVNKTMRLSNRSSIRRSKLVRVCSPESVQQNSCDIRRSNSAPQHEEGEYSGHFRISWSMSGLTYHMSGKGKWRMFLNDRLRKQKSPES